MKHFYKMTLFCLSAIYVTSAYSQINGSVGYHIETNRLTNILNRSCPTIAVNAYDIQNQLIISTVTDSSGKYRLDIPLGRKVRVEFGNFPLGFTPAAGQARTQFVISPAVVNLSLWQTNQYVGHNPKAAQVVYTGKNISEPSIVSISATGSTESQGVLATVKETGSLWGLAYDRNSKRLFAAAFVKRHSLLGLLGTGGIYVKESQSNTVQPFIDLTALGVQTIPTNFKQDLSDKAGAFSHDSLVFSQVAKVGLGGLDVSEDGQFLWVMNLFDRKLYRISLLTNQQKPTSSDIVGFALPSLERRGEKRPFAVKVYAGKVYVGIVNDATGDKATSNDLRAYVLAFDPNREKFEEVFSTSLDYKRGNTNHNTLNWHPWVDDYNKVIVKDSKGWMICPQPVLADIEFDTDGSMILGIMDRLGHQTGEGHLYRPKGIQQLQQVRGLSNGDILRVSFNPAARENKRYELEKNGQAGSITTAGHDNGEGPNGGEFYFDDTFKANGVTWHTETATGGLALLPDQQQLLAAVREPEIDGYLGGGIKWFNNKTGVAERALSLLPKGKANPFGKANNVGDIELVTDVPPTEIGDRIWQDCDEDGIQDADENPLSDVEVGLYQNGQLVAITKSDSLGQYLFTDSKIKGGLKPRTAYELKVAVKQVKYTELKLTLTGQGNNAEIDNDAVLRDGYATIKFETTALGENIHNLDFGFRCADKPQITAKLECVDQTATLTLAGHKVGDRFDIALDRNYTGNVDYEHANILNKNGHILSDQLANWPDEVTVRVFTNTGCFTDVFVKQADAVGCAQKVKGDEVAGLSISPNPTSDYILIHYRSQRQQGKVQVLLTDLQGRPINNQEVELKQGRYQTQFNLTQQPTGSYIVVVQDVDQKFSQIIIKR